MYLAIDDQIHCLRSELTSLTQAGYNEDSHEVRRKSNELSRLESHRLALRHQSGGQLFRSPAVMEDPLDSSPPELSG
jgi:hypothetical protein